MVDYSKWDHFGEDSSEEEDEGEGGIVHRSVEDGAVVRCEPRSHASRGMQPRITRLDKPSTVSFGGELDKKETGKKLRVPNLGCVTNEYGWEQTAITIDFYLKVPPKIETGKRMPKLDLKLGMPPITATDCSYPAALGARAFREDDEGVNAFPSAHGIVIDWFLDAEPSCGVGRLWSWIEEKKSYHFDQNFPLPISDDEETWLWTLTDECPFFDGRALHFHARKKTSAALAGVTLWWDRLFSREPKLDLKDELMAQSSPTAKAFSEAWDKAHQLFREQIKERNQLTHIDDTPNSEAARLNSGESKTGDTHSPLI